MNADRDPSSDTPIEPDREVPTPPPALADTPDPGDDVPVPGAMSAAEIDERAQVVEALRREDGQDEPRPVEP